MNPIDDIPYVKGPGENLFFLILVGRQQSLGVDSPEDIQLMYNFPGWGRDVLEVPIQYPEAVKVWNGTNQLKLTLRKIELLPIWKLTQRQFQG